MKYYISKKELEKNLIEFEIIKFATMLKNSPNLGDGIYTADEDFRILKFGKFLRKTKINELPQIFNILFGNMSIVGPRPLIKETFKFYKETRERKNIINQTRFDWYIFYFFFLKKIRF